MRLFTPVGMEEQMGVRRWFESQEPIVRVAVVDTNWPRLCSRVPVPHSSGVVSG